MALTDNFVWGSHCDEASGTLLDVLGSYDLTDHNTVGSASGLLSGARDFERGNSEYFSYASNSTFNIGDNDCHFGTWVKPESIGSKMMILCKENSGTDGGYYYLSIGADGKITFEVFGAVSFGSGGSVTANTFGALSAGTFYRVDAWHDATANQIGVAINAGTADTASHSAGIYAGLGDFQVGGEGGSSNFYDGLIDEIGLWKRVLTGGERTSLYNGGAGLAYPFTIASATTPRLTLLGVG